MIQTSPYVTRRAARRVGRDEYPATERNPIVIASWATKPNNIGSICRLSEAFLVEHLYALRGPAGGTDVGTSRWQPLTRGHDLNTQVDLAKMNGYSVVALEQTDQSIPLHEVALPLRMCLLVGNEGSGLPASALGFAQMAVEIEQYGFVGSLNVATATAIALYEWSRQHDKDAVSLWR